MTAQRILVVEDDHKVALLLEVVLTEEGFAVERAGDGEVAVEKGRADRFDLILLDQMLPRKQGLEVVRELRAEGCAAPILMLTARDAPDDMRIALATGANDFVGKPFRFDELLDRIRALLP